MHWESALTVSAEIGIGVAGFSGIFVAIARRGGGEWQPRQALALDVLLLASGSALFASLLPFLMMEVRLAPASTWASASALYALWFVGIGVFRLRSPALTARGLAVTVGVSSLWSVLMLANAIWLRAAWLYMLAVYWQLLVAFGMFVMLLRDTAGSPGQRP